MARHEPPAAPEANGGPGPPAFAQRFAAIPDSVGDARRCLVAALEEWGLPEATLADVALAVSEACTNVVLHAYVDRPAGDFALHAAIVGATVQVSVADAGCGLAPRPDSPGLGLGLTVIAAVAGNVVVSDSTGGGTLVSMTFDVAAS